MALRGGEAVPVEDGLKVTPKVREGESVPRVLPDDDAHGDNETAGVLLAAELQEFAAVREASAVGVAAGEAVSLAVPVPGELVEAVAHAVPLSLPRAE